MSIRDNFAANLSRLVRGRGSITFVARQLDMSRQQLGYYLNGQHTPNKATLRNLCRYFRVTEDYLFQADIGDEGAETASVEDSCAQIVSRLKSDPSSIKPGHYATYFWGNRFPDKIVGALTIVRKDSDAVSFRRITASTERRPNSRWSYVRGDHQGVVTEKLNWVYFQGSNRLEPHEPTLLALQWAVTTRPMLLGHGMVITASGPEIIRVAMRHVPTSPLRTALTLSRVYSIDTNEVDEFVVGALQQSL